MEGVYVFTLGLTTSVVKGFVADFSVWVAEPIVEVMLSRLLA